MADLRDLDPDVPVPDLAFFVLGKEGDVIERFDVDDKGQFQVDEAALEKARRVVLAPRDAEPTKLGADHSLFGHRCEPVCEGLVEVYQGTCCCRPWIVHDPRIPQLLDHLEEIVEVEPPVPPVPPVLEAERVPLKTLETSPLFQGGTLSEMAVNMGVGRYFTA